MLTFKDASVSLGVGELAASMPEADLRRLILLYTAFFDRVPDAISLSYWIERFKAGMTIVDIANSFDIGGMSNAEFVHRIARNTFGAAALFPETMPNWIQELENKTLMRGQVVRIALNIAESYKGNPENGDVAALLDNKFIVGFHLAVQQGLSLRDTNEVVRKDVQISAAVTPSSATEAIALSGAAQPGFSLYTKEPRHASDLITLDVLRACPSAMSDRSPAFYRCIVGHASGTTDSGGAPCRLTVHEDGRLVVTTPAGTNTVFPPYGNVTYSKLDHTREGFFTLAASIAEGETGEMQFSMAFTSPALAHVIGTVPGIRLTSGAFSCTLGI